MEELFWNLVDELRKTTKSPTNQHIIMSSIFTSDPTLGWRS
jgi:hypothetical protein